MDGAKMIGLWLTPLFIFIIAVLMSMTGRGGGNFYVPILLASGVPILQASTSGQLILVATAIAASVIYHKHRTVDWKLALVIDPPTDIMAFVGGLWAHRLPGTALKFVFASLLVLAAFFMLRPFRERDYQDGRRFGFWNRTFGDFRYRVNLWLAIPITAATGLVAGMVGISGGSFKIPLMVLACGVPMRIAVGTSSVMVAATALMGFAGHAAAGDFNPAVAIPVMIVAVAGGIIGGRFSLKTDARKLKMIFAFTTLGAAVFMYASALLVH
jgi:uncharacterized protein